MTKIITIAVVALMLGSCKKDRECECTTTDTGYNLVNPNPPVVVHVYPEQRKRIAKKNCEGLESKEPSYVRGANGNYVVDPATGKKVSNGYLITKCEIK